MVNCHESSKDMALVYPFSIAMLKSQRLMIFIGIHMQISRIFDSYDIDVRYPCGHEDSTNQKWDYKTTNQKLLFMGYDKEILDLNN